MKDQLRIIRESRTSEDLYNEWGKYYNDVPISGKISKQILEQNNINIDEMKKNIKNMNLSPREQRYIDDVGGLITNIATIRRVRADLEGNDPVRLENFKKWLDEQETRDTGRLNKLGIDVNHLNLSPIYPRTFFDIISKRRDLYYHPSNINDMYLVNFFENNY